MLAQIAKLALLVTLLSSAGCIHHYHDHDRRWDGHHDSHDRYDRYDRDDGDDGDDGDDDGHDRKGRHR